jgi:hypothetical protein
MPDNTQQKKHIKSDKVSLEILLSTSIYLVTGIMILAYLYQ